MIKNDKGINPKIEWTIDNIKKSKQHFIIYSALYDTGIRQLEAALLKSKIKYVKITGNESAVKKEQSKLYFNGYNFNDS